MERIVSGKVLVEPLGMLVDCYDGPESVAFFKSYSNRSPCEIAQERFWEKLDDLGLIEKDKPYVLTYKSKFSTGWSPLDAPDTPWLPTKNWYCFSTESFCIAEIAFSTSSVRRSLSLPTIS